jgi:hypothetical protein
MHLSWLEAFGLTLAVESVAALSLAPAFQISRRLAVLSAVLASTATHPILWYTFYTVYAVLGAVTTPALEAVVILAEAPFYRFIARVGWLDALLLSLLINAASWAAGELIYALL